MLAAVIAFIAVIGGFKYFQIRSAMAGMSYQPPPEAVTTVIARQEEWSSTLKAIGTVAATFTAFVVKVPASPRSRGLRLAPICPASWNGLTSTRGGR